MPYQVVDTLTDKVLGSYESEAKAERAIGHLWQEPNENRYAVVAPAKPKKVSKKKTAVSKEADVKEESN